VQQIVVFKQNKILDSRTVDEFYCHILSKKVFEDQLVD